MANATIKDPAIDVITLGNISKDVSKLVDSNGEPLVVFRGMSEKSSKKYVFNYNYYQIKESGRRNKLGFYFTDNYDVARGYAIDSSRKKIIEKIKNIYNVYENSNDFEDLIKRNTIDPFAKVTIKLKNKNFFERLNDIILSNIKSNLTIDKMATELFISKSALDKKIRRDKQMNTTTYVREFRIEYAIRMIEAGETNVQQLADACGFNSLSYFSISFNIYIRISN